MSYFNKVFQMPKLHRYLLGMDTFIFSLRLESGQLLKYDYENNY